jgi:hypothetical protein
MKSQGYMTRALQSRDRRYVTVLEKLGYRRPVVFSVDWAEPAAAVAARDLLTPTTAAPDTADEPQPAGQDDLAALRADYERVLGKKPFHGWDAAALREKIAAAAAGEI